MARKNNIFKQTNKRIIMIMLFFAIIMALVVSNVIFTMATGSHFRSGTNVLKFNENSGIHTESIVSNRGTIYDRNKEVIAQDIEAFDLIAIIDENRVNATDKKAYVDDIDTTCDALSPILEVEAAKLREFLVEAKDAKSYQTEFGAYGKTLSAQQKEDIQKLNLPGLEFRKSTDRVYPVGTFASQLIGYAQYNYDASRIKGVMGIENIFDKELKGKDGEVVYQIDSDGDYLPKSRKYTKTAENGNDIYLTIDKNVQVTLEKALSDTMESNNANSAWGVVMEAKTGKVLAQAGYPTFDLNEREQITNFFNTPSEVSFEPGSVMKPFVFAGAMQEGVYNGNTLFNSKSTSLGVDGAGNLVQVAEGAANWLITVNDALGKDYGTITYDEGLIRSTNTVIANMFLNVFDMNKNIEYLKKFGFFEYVDLHGMNEDKGILNENSITDKIVLGFGQGSRVTTYQLIQAASAIFGDGSTLKPYVIDKIVDPNTGDTVYKGKVEKSEQILSTETVMQLQSLLRKIVEEPHGTAHHYAMNDITMMAKTGTGEIAVEGGYSRSIFTSSIMAAAPADNPEIIIYYAFESSNILSYNTSYFQDIVREALLAVDGYNSTNTDPVVNATQAKFNVFTMPSLVNHSLIYGKDKLGAQTTNIVVIGDGSVVISQYPLASSQAISSQKIFLLTDGAYITMPNMTGWTRKDVNLFAKMSGIKIQISGSGNVTNQSIPEATSINVDSVISVELK